MPNYVFNDGGREAAGYKGVAGDCVVRAIAIATSKPYQEVYDAINDTAKSTRGKRARGSTARNGVSRIIYKRYLEALGWKWIPTMRIGSGCKVHLRKEELPGGRIITRLSKHLSAVINGVVHDIYDPSREGTRCVYGYFVFTGNIVPPNNGS